jgi:hypothetical protein
MTRYLACIVYRLFTKGQAWVDRGTEHFERNRQTREALGRMQASQGNRVGEIHATSPADVCRASTHSGLEPRGCPVMPICVHTEIARMLIRKSDLLAKSAYPRIALEQAELGICQCSTDPKGSSGSSTV